MDISRTKLNTKQLAELLMIKPATIRQYVYNGSACRLLPPVHHTPNGRLFFYEDEYNTWDDSHSNGQSNDLIFTN